MIRKATLALEGRKVVYREAGAGAAVIVVSGLGLSGRFYDRNLPAFADAGLRMIVPDLPGFGGTRGGRVRGQSVAETCAFLRTFADALGIARATWIGHSIGAQAALQLAAEAPQRARALVLVGPTGEPRALPLARQAVALAAEALRAPLPVVLRVLSDYVRISPLAYLGTWVRYARAPTDDVLARVACPTLLLVGTEDPVVRMEWLELLQRRLPVSRLVRLAGGTHALPRSHAPEFNRVVIEFCRDLLQAPSIT